MQKVLEVKDYIRGETDEEIIEHLLRAEDDIRNGRVSDAMEFLKEMPERFAKIEKLDMRTERQYRRMVVKHYAILYTIDYENSIIYIAHMYYVRRNYIENLP